MKRIPVTFYPPKLAVSRKEAEDMLGCKRTTLWLYTSTGRLETTPWGAVVVASMERLVNGRNSQRRSA
jgi:hypothetical protein